MTRTYRDYLVDILTAAMDACTFIEDIDFDDFLADKEKQYAVLRALEIIGEAAGGSFTAQRPQNLQQLLARPLLRFLSGRTHDRIGGGGASKQSMGESSSMRRVNLVICTPPAHPRMPASGQ